MDCYVAQNKIAWEHDAYHFWVWQNGTPEERAKKDLENPKGMLKHYARYFEETKGLKVANICGSCGKKAVPLAILGASVTVFDLSEDNKRYACETAKAAGVQIDFVVGNVLDIDRNIYEGYFDIVFMEGGILHYFHDINQFMGMMYRLLKKGGRMICSDFHPAKTKLNLTGDGLGDYFNSEVIEGEMAHARFYEEDIRRNFPKCLIRLYTLSEIMNAVIDQGFRIQRFEEYPYWENKKLPGEFTIVADREH